MVRYAAQELGFFVVQNAKRMRLGNTKHAIALVRIMEGTIDAAGLSVALAHNFQIEWEWQVKEYGPKSFLVKFPNLAKIDECSQYEQFKLKGQQVQISVVRWSSAALAKARLHTVWVKASRVPEEMMSIEGVQEIASSLGALQQIDLESLNEYDVVRFLVDVKDPAKIPIKFEFAQRPFLYDIFFKVESVVEQGGLMPEYAKIPLNQPHKDQGTQEKDDSRSNKKPKSDGGQSKAQDKETQEETCAEEEGAVLAQSETSGTFNHRSKQQEEVGDGNKNIQGEPAVGDYHMEEDKITPSANTYAQDSTELGEKVNLSESISTSNTNDTPFGHAFGITVSGDSVSNGHHNKEAVQQHKNGIKKERGVGQEDLKEPRRCARFSGQEDVNRVEKALERAKFKDLVSGVGTTTEEEKRRG
uniref:Uncharacterized protein n=1 Tax=Arundo donax TaxID=35708 RepID=A0A0A8Z892_ARUDO